MVKILAEFGQNDGILGFLTKKTGHYQELKEDEYKFIKEIFFPFDDKSWVVTYGRDEKFKHFMTLEKDRRENHKRNVMIYLYGYPRYNYCKNFRLEDLAEETLFNRRFHPEKLRWVLWKEYDWTEKLLNILQRRVKKKSNIIIVIYGTPNSGKSEVSQTIAKYIQYLFKVYFGASIDINVTFSTGDFNSILRTMSLGDIVIRDESPKIIGEGSKNVGKNLDNITKITRANQNTYIFINPKVVKPEVVSLYLEMAGKDENRRMCRCILYGKNNDYIGHIYVPLHNDEEFRQEYLRKKQENIDTLMKHSGQVTVDIDLEKLKIDVKRLYAWCKKIGVTAKNELMPEIAFLNDELEETEKIRGDITYINALIHKTWAEFKRVKSGKKLSWETEEEKKVRIELEEEEKDEMLKLISKFEWENAENEILSSLRRKRKYKKEILERQIKVYEFVRDTPNKKVRREKLKEFETIYKVKDIGADYYTIKFQKEPRKKKFGEPYLQGKMFENKFEEYLKSLDFFEEVIRDGRRGEPDIYCFKENKLYVFSLKCHTLSRSNMDSINPSEYEPEASFCYRADYDKKYSDVFLYVVLFDTFRCKIWCGLADFKEPKLFHIEF